MSQKELMQSLPDRDGQGYLKDTQDWTPAVAEIIAIQEGIELTPTHWMVVITLREFFLKHGVLPPMRGLILCLNDKLPSNQNTSLYLQSLFPKGLMRQASKIGGLPKPVRCI